MEPKPIQIHIPPSLHHLAIPLSTFLSQNKGYAKLVVSSYIFTSSISVNPGPHLLLVQRAASEYSFPNLWEVPGGSCEASDPTILHSLAREAFEETGLRLTRFNRQIGSGFDFVTGYGVRQKRWRKLSFEIEVAEIEANDMSCGKSGGVEKARAKDAVAEDGVVRVDAIDQAGKEGELDGVSITLDPEEHQAYAWVTEEEINEGKYAIVTAEQKDLMLEAFTLRKADEAKAMLDGAISGSP
ncbi:hypothetical protein IMSHALPRED_010872 [Imshaugia aleurites]|uniref:Nudix hydrolase domain-containing protein n=1 Tax=Imshaugia aleurites TaxID=172621 RepID=A0A8H3IWM6_9LECA|nr:hypothetical protein IMSHALPRED_010872 [Imshaugia aleurites]